MKSKTFHKCRFHLFRKTPGLEAGGMCRRKKLILLSRWITVSGNTTGTCIFTKRYDYHKDWPERVTHKLLTEVPPTP